MEKLVLKARDTKDAKYNPVWMNAEVHSELKELSGQLGIPMRELGTQLIRFGMEHMTVEPSDNGQVPN
ncbi:hypothetical protein G7084_00255 [Weissella coleopterorum]|uniref:Uncharacterized protein n=1 Tax=Weissella coleopterorum TaxID=2714949 RepID=A0A6G8AXR1_9LACO|nr:hypothetical protein [Weissella coleopterorum]QIL49891.1 hypothetical protein G7084_00255 [Weissella coleopterorum]